MHRKTKGVLRFFRHKQFVYLFGCYALDGLGQGTLKFEDMQSELLYYKIHLWYRAEYNILFENRITYCTFYGMNSLWHPL